MSIESNAVKHAVSATLESEIETAEAKLQTLKARAKAVKANVEIVAIADLLTQKAVLQQKLQALQKSGADRWEHAKADLEARIADFKTSIKEIEAKMKAH
jgi:ADP-dependent phosphofructokinase/glucokinase